MKKFLLSLFALVAVVGLANAQSVTLSANDATDFTGTHNPEKPAEGSSNGEAENWKPLESLKIGDYSFTFAGSEDGKSQPAFYKVMSGKTGDYTIRLYQQCSMTIIAPAGVEMSAISFKGSNAGKGLVITPDSGTLTLSGSNATWTGKASSLKLTVSATWRVIEMTVSTGDAPDDPTPDEPKDGATFKAVTSVTSGSYLIVAQDTKCAVALADTKTYGYLPVVDVVVKDNAVYTEKSYAYEINAVDGGYTIKDNLGRYLYMKDTYNSFNLTDDLGETDGGAVFSITPGENGTFVIANVLKEKTLQFDPNYNSYGAYPDVRGIYPVLYKMENSGIEAVAADNAAPVEYYTIQGVRVNGDNLPAGLYIRRQGAATAKVLVK